jgi:hypothetical protein
MSANLDLVRSIFSEAGRGVLETVRTPLSLDGLVGSRWDERLGLTRTAVIVSFPGKSYFDALRRPARVGERAEGRCRSI